MKQLPFKFLTLMCILYNLVENGSTIIEDFAQCQVYNSKGYGYKKFFELRHLKSRSSKYLVDLHFSVRTPRDAHILLSPSKVLDSSAPVYEIVLGAGRNSFSDIRRQQRGRTVFTNQTKDLLSAFEQKSFWLHISTDGVIEMGLNGSSTGFLVYKDVDLLPVQFLSFSSWSGVEASWEFDCPQMNHAGSSIDEDGPADELVGVQLTHEERLRLGLLWDYDPMAIAIGDETEGDRLDVHLQMTISHLSLDERQSGMTVYAKMMMVWKDSKLKWNPSEFGNLSTFTVPYRSIWKPEVVLYNSLDMRTDIFQMAPIVIHSDGNVYWSPQAEMKVGCDVSSLDHWPFDEQSCEIHLGFWSQRNRLRLVPYTALYQFEQHTSSQWKVVDFIMGTSAFKTPWTGEMDPENTTMAVKLQIERRNQALGVIYAVPLFVVGTCMLATLWTSPMNHTKISLCCFQLVLASIILVTISLRIPIISGHIPGIIKITGMALIGSTVLVFLSILVIGISRHEHQKPLPELLCRILSSSSVQTALHLPPVKNAMTYGKINALQDTPSNIQDIWLVFGVTIDRILFFAYSCFVAFLFFRNY